MAEYCWMFPNMSENASRNCSDYTRILNMLRYSYDNIIIIVTNVIILGFLSELWKYLKAHQFLASESPLKKMENAFYFTLIFRSPDI